jgi:O-methyltransferase involved in polyketide biosynthesis
MDARAYRLPCLRNCQVFEMDIKAVLDYKTKTIATVRPTGPRLSQWKFC